MSIVIAEKGVGLQPNGAVSLMSAWRGKRSGRPGLSRPFDRRDLQRTQHLHSADALLDPEICLGLLAGLLLEGVANLRQPDLASQPLGV